MMIELYPPIALHEKGRREKNEDYIYPVLGDGAAMATSKFFLVCDGVGGAEKGEEASRIACEAFANDLKQIEQPNSADIERALMMAEYNIDVYVETYPEADGMATTLTLVVFDGAGATVAHIGDSRIYHLRKGEILFKTRDHSLVNEMVLNNIITEEEAATHPKRNVVSRAIMGRQRPARLDIAQIADVRPGDYFFLCSDGILESVSGIMLASILGDENNTDDYKMSQIFALCQQYSKDNFSAYLLHIKSVGHEAAAVAASSINAGDKKEQAGLFPKWMAYLLIFSSLATVGMVLLLVFPIKPTPVKNTPTPPSQSDSIDSRSNLDSSPRNQETLYLTQK